MTAHACDERQKAVDQAFEDMRQAVLEIGASLGEAGKDRCPYRMADETCTFEGGCRNRKGMNAENAICGGDHFLDRTPATEKEQSG